MPTIYTTYHIDNVLQPGPVYRGYKMLAFLFNLVPDMSSFRTDVQWGTRTTTALPDVLYSVQGRPWRDIHIGRESIHGGTYDYTDSKKTSVTLGTEPTDDLVWLNMQGIFDNMQSGFYADGYIGRFNRRYGNIVQGVVGGGINGGVGDLGYTTENVNYADGTRNGNGQWFYLMCNVDRNGYALPAAGGGSYPEQSRYHGLDYKVHFKMIGQYLQNNEPKIRYSRMYGLPAKSPCPGGTPILFQNNYTGELIVT